MELLQPLLLSLFGAASLFYFFVKVSLSHWKQRGILHEKPKFLWGNLKGVGHTRHITHAVAGIYEKYKGKAPFIGFYTFLKPMVMVLDLDLVQRILSRDAALHFMDRGLYHNAADDPLSCNLLQLDGAQWRQLNAQVHQLYSAERLPSLLPGLLTVAECFKRSLTGQRKSDEKEGIVDDVYSINSIVDCYNLDVISLLAFGLEGDSLRQPTTEFRCMTERYLSNYQLLKAYFAFHFPLLARLCQYKSYDEQATAYFMKLVGDKMKEREWQNPQSQLLTRQQDFLRIYAELQRHNSNAERRLSNKEIAAQSFSFILAGLEPCNSTLTFCLYELALQPDLQQRAHEEIASVLQQNGGQLRLEDLQKMHYLKQTLYETLRIHSPYPLLLRNTIKDYEVPDSVFMLKQDNHVIIPISAIHHDPDFYPEPAKFDPDRFTPAAIAQRHPMSFLPFGYGPRSCVARPFVELQLLLALAVLLAEYEFSPCSDTHIPLQYDHTKLILTPKSDVWLRMKPRKSQ